MTPTEIENLPYTAFIGFINQWNVPPGSFDTLNRWRTYSNLNKKSRLLEVACTTGFSSRELALSTGCAGVGIDISKESIFSAEQNKKQYAPFVKIKYEVADAEQYAPRRKFSHVVAGASVKFFKNKQTILDRFASFLEDGGYLLVAPFYVEDGVVPPELIKKCHDVFGITITTESYKEIMWDYRNFEIAYERKNEITQETEQELAFYCDSTINRLKKTKPDLSEEALQIARERLMRIKKTTNELRVYQSYVTLVLRYRKAFYGNRYVELF